MLQAQTYYTNINGARKEVTTLHKQIAVEYFQKYDSSISEKDVHRRLPKNKDLHAK